MAPPHPRLSVCARNLPIGAFATTAKLTLSVMWGTSPSIASMIDVHDGQPASSGTPEGRQEKTHFAVLGRTQ